MAKDMTSFDALNNWLHRPDGDLSLPQTIEEIRKENEEYTQALIPIPEPVKEKSPMSDPVVVGKHDTLVADIKARGTKALLEGDGLALQKVSAIITEHLDGAEKDLKAIDSPTA